MTVRLMIYIIGIGFPIFAMWNCSGFNEGSMVVKDCIIDSNLLRNFSSFCYGVVTISSFMMFIPIILYIYIIHNLSKRIGRRR